MSRQTQNAHSVKVIIVYSLKYQMITVIGPLYKTILAVQ